jgi:type IV pilus assembly protein PilY1
MAPFRNSTYRRCLAGTLAALVGLGPLLTPAYAQLTALGDQPIGAQVKAKPNIMMTVDDSSSMLYDFLPDSVIGTTAGPGNYCRDVTGKMNAQCGLFDIAIDLTVQGRGRSVSPGYVYEQFGYPYPAYQNTIRIQGAGGLSAPKPITNSGPGAGCNALAQPDTTCSGGIDPTTVAGGIERYPNPPGPPPAKSPKAGNIYDYWSLWPAPAHNSELNHLYYNPRITYSPPVHFNGVFYDPMDAGHSANWTHVVADPWAETLQYVNLTTQVTIGMWCNSDWSVGHENDAAYCRTNGTGAGAATSKTATANGDYRYPWAPTGINPDDGVQPTTAKSIAMSKVVFDPLLHKYNVNPATWPGARDPKYFYENDNILWCDPTNPLFPARGTVIPGVCNSSPPTPQHCTGFVTHACTGGAHASCLGGSAQTCDHADHQTCVIEHNTCGGTVPQSCVAAPDETCQGVGHQTCGPASPQTCDGFDDATCGSFTPQACVGVGPQFCNITAPVCVPPAVGAGHFDPPGCETICHPGDAECACTFIPDDSKCSTNLAQSCDTAATCPAPGSCSSFGEYCDAVTACPIHPLHCATDGNVCTSSADCRPEGTCHGGACHAGDTCHQDGVCSDHSGTCTGHASGECPPSGICSLEPLRACITDGGCPDLHGSCSITHSTDCFTDPQCAQTARCSGDNNPCSTLGATAECPDQNGVCTVDAAHCVVTPVDNCTPAGHCTGPIGNVCHDDTQCLPTGGQCSGGSHAPCDDVVTTCPYLQGTCNAGTARLCSDDNACDVVGATCSGNGNACSYQPGDCPTDLGYCSGDPSQTPVCVDDGPCHDIPGSGFCNAPFQTIACSTNNDCPGTGTDPAVAVCSDALNGAIGLLDGNFEVPITTISYAPLGTPWTFGGGAGIQRYGSPFGSTDSGNGSQTAFLQNVSSILQRVAVPAGTYTISFLAARRGSQINPVQVTIDGVPLGGPIVPADATFATFTFPFTIAAGSHDFMIAGTNGIGDNTTFIDAVAINGMSLLEDANGAGIVCRHNNKDYGAGAGAYDYPNAQFNTPVTAGTGPNACTPSPRYASVARHYWKTGVEWCDSAVTTLGDDWLGYGSHDGTCQDSSDSSHPIPRFYQFGAETGCDAVSCPPGGIPPSAAYLDNYATPAFQRMDLNALANPNFTHNFIDDSHTLQSIGRDFNAEMTNYANWFAYYRTRITAVKTVTSLVFQAVDAQYRVGFETLYVDPHTTNVQKFLNIADFTAPQPGLFYGDLFDIIVPLGQQTPTLDAMVRIGEHFKTGTVAGLPGSVNPITLSCQKNWHVLFTDGYTNQPTVPAPVGDMDLTVPNYPGFTAVLPALPDPIGGLVPLAPWPRPYLEDTVHPSSNSLADYAMYYWVTDLKPGMINNVPTCPSPRSVTCSDPANWQHVNFAAIALGTSGKLSASSPAATEALLTSGALQWPQPTPSVNKPDSSGVDDLWHAAVNSRGGFVNAETPDDVQLGLGQLLQAALNSTGTRAGVGFLSNTFGPSAMFLYRAQFTAGWGGSLAKIQFDPTTGVPGAQQWDAADRLAAQLVVDAGHGKPTPWFSERKIVTMTEGGVKIPFLWTNLSASQKDSLAPGKPTRGQAVLEFLRGNRSKEGVKLGQFRKRPSNTVLGDIVDSSPLYVGAPNWPYTDDNDPGYSTFVTANSARAARIYVGANDGMLHAFDDVTGNETWAYVPSSLFRSDSTGLGGLSYQDGALPPFRHHFYVDATPRVVDVDFNAPAGDQWHSILVAGMGKGGKRYYALDVTHPVDGGVTEDASKSNILWEFPAPGDTTTDMGYTYGRPFIAKTHAFGNEWMVIVPSGYNNPNSTGGGELYFLRARDGHLEMTLTAGASCSNGEPAGLAHAAGYSKDFRNQLVEQVYVGDLCGNLWRFDVSDPDPSTWQAKVGVMGRLVDAHGAPQPVTTPPEIKIDPDNGVDRWVFVGTGRLLDDSDLTSPSPPQQQTLYAFRDGTDTTPLPLLVPPLSRTTVGMELLPSASAVNHFGLAAKPDKGWWDDLPTDPSQRIIVPPQAAAGVIGYVGTSPPLDDPCLTALPATVYARAYSTGQSVLVDSDGTTILPSIYSDTGGVGVAIVAFETSGGATGLDVRVAITGFDGSVKYYKTKPTSSSNKYRMSWRLLGQ